MKVCIPTMGNAGLTDQVGEHFGRVPTYTIVDTETSAVHVVDNTSEHMGGTGYPPEIIKGHGAEVMLCSGLGRRAIMLFEEMGIMVYIGARGTVAAAIEDWKDNKLQAATDANACQQHAFRSEHHGGHTHHQH